MWIYIRTSSNFSQAAIWSSLWPQCGRFSVFRPQSGCSPWNNPSTRRYLLHTWPTKFKYLQKCILHVFMKLTRLHASALERLQLVHLRKDKHSHDYCDYSIQTQIKVSEHWVQLRGGYRPKSNSYSNRLPDSTRTLALAELHSSGNNAAYGMLIEHFRLNSWPKAVDQPNQPRERALKTTVPQFVNETLPQFGLFCFRRIL